MSRSLLAVLAAAVIGLAACGTADPSTDDTGTPVETPTTDTTPSETDAPTPSEPSETASDPSETAAPAATETDTAADGAVAPVVLRFDGREVPVATSCAGADGAILATTEGEVTVTLVREEGLAMRWQAEGTEAETDEVVEAGGTDTTTYRATLSSDDVEPVEVEMVVMDDAFQALEDC